MATTEKKTKHGGKRRRAGRPKGSRTRYIQEQAKAIIESGLTPLEFMMRIVRDSQYSVDQRLEAAAKAAPYVHARLAITQLDINDSRLLSAEERRARVLELLGSNQVARLIGRGGAGVTDAQALDVLPGPGAAAP